ncbi:microcystin dependent MdpB family protein [Geotalea uraniireducens]|uniref:Microcystin dependent MdpB family protein n=1 Tax=Geotalea uraniireducens TaxID=351604 RepID=A0ABM8ER28_9BACT|nr:tail fiber protein [Geotalea uraniireducens]BDV44554.1 microcystin dependent MdpB family protein [Geotalea uraniireducens]
MSDCFIGEIRMFAGNYAPVNWALCDGRTLRVNDYQPLFALIGVTYGGDGVTTFNLPDLRGRVPLHKGQAPNLTARPLGSSFGTELVSLQVANIPNHTHAISVGGDATTTAPADNYPANSAAFSLYSDATSDAPMSGVAVEPSAGAAFPHDNVMPALSVNFIIALAGEYPQQS